ncbi:cytochrome P450 6g1-like isoform X1 [Musca domestica]|uniref:Cytochrome P450 6g1-like isoform X1 n=1 Tax=Musca domestica TaxID=7370 RepID=A0ABM3UQW3_MUSDO|nr:cytochrome P450 6g1-like isoform X1 [Musca domestica]
MDRLLSLFGVISLFVLLIYRWYRKHFDFWKHHPVVPSVPGRIFGGKVNEILTLKTNFSFHVKTIYDNEQFSNEAAVGIYALRPALLLRDPELIKSILIRDFNCFANRYGRSDPHADPIGDKSLFFARYNSWREWRLKLSPIFTSGKMKQMYPLIQQVGENLEEYLHKRGERFVCECKQLAILFTIDSIATTVFGVATNSLENSSSQAITQQIRQLVLFNLRRALNFFVVFMAPNLNWLFRPSIFFRETVEFFKTHTTQNVEERIRNPIRRPDMIELVVKLRNEVVEKGGDIKEFMEYIVAQTVTFFSGGTETSSTTIANVLFELAKNPHIQQRLRQELLDAFSRGNSSISYEDLSELEYLSMVVDETLRMYPVFPLIERQYLNPKKEVSEGYSLRPFYDFEIPNGMPVYISVYGLHYDEKYWTDPRKFDPERFSPENKANLNPMIYLPFGGGPRNCIGARMGLIQVKTCIAYILKNHRIEICSETNLQTKFNPKAFVLQVEGGINLEIVRDELYKRSVTKLE